MKPPYTGTERRKVPLLELLTKRVVVLEIEAHQQKELLELAVAHLTKEVAAMKDICRSCVCFQDDYK